jgi:NADPH2:quinone reductase
MYAWTLEKFGHFKDVLQWTEVPKPQPKENEALIKVSASGVNFPDLLAIAGKYQIRPPLPFIPGGEAAGIVVGKGEKCCFNIGDRVMGTNFTGAYAEYMLLEEQAMFKVPEIMSDKEAGGFLIVYQTSYFGLVHRARLQTGEILLVHGGAGGVGLAAIQIGKALGATVIATASSAEKLDICRQSGAHHAINYQKEDFVEAVTEITQGKGADVIYDPVGGDVFDMSTKCIAFEGRLIVIGFASGRIPEIAANRILLKNISVMGLLWGSYKLHNPQSIADTQNSLYEFYSQNKIKPVIYRSFPLNDLPEALELLESRRSYGKMILLSG